MNECENKGEVVVGNAFPMTLIREHRVVVEEVPVAEVAAQAQARGARSFWGHENTRTVAETILGVGLRPATPRPAIVLEADRYPSLDGQCFKVCYVLSPDYRAGFRPAVGEEIGAEDIRGWHALKLTWRP